MTATEAPVAPQSPQLDEEQKLRVQLAQFVMDFIKAMTKTGYYDPDHPEARQARAGLHAQLRTLLKGRFELGFVRTTAAEHPEIIVEGVLPEPINLAALLGKGVGALFVPKLYEYFERHALQSFAIKAETTEQEFETLVDVITREPGVGRGQGKANLGQVLLDRHVYHVSTLFSEELVGRERRINWRVRLALSRLKKDLRIVPMYKQAGAQAAQRATQQILKEVSLHIRRPDLLCSLLLNCDLVGADPAIVGDIPIETQIVPTLPPLLIPPTLMEATGEVAGMARGAGTVEQVSGAPRLRRLLADLADRSHGIGGDAGFDAVTTLFQAKLLTAGDLSPGLKEFLHVQRFAQTLATDAEGGLKQLRDLLARPGGPAAAPLGPLAADLVRRAQYPTACAVLGLARDHPQARAKARETLGRETVLRPLLQKFVAGHKEVREQVADVFTSIGPAAVEPLIELFCQTEDRGVRRAACAAAARFGAEALGALVDRLEQREQPWYVIRNVLMVLAEIGLEAPVDLRRYMRHEHPKVREEAVNAIARLPMAGAETLLLNALRDSHATVRARAVAGLGALRTKNVGALHFIVEAVRRKTSRETEEDDAVQIQACGALQHLGNIRFGADRRVDAVLAEALEGQAKRGFLGVFGGGGFRAKSLAVRAAIVETLATIGTSAAADALKHVMEGEDVPLASRAREALKKVQLRPAA